MVSQPMENKDFCVASSEKTIPPGGSGIVNTKRKLIPIQEVRVEPTILLELPFPVYSESLFSRYRVVFAFMPTLDSVQPCELL
jgi:hypothetical protein